MEDLLTIERERLRIAKLSYGSLRKETELYELVVRVGAGLVPLRDVEPAIDRINQKYRERRVEVEAEQVAE